MNETHSLDFAGAWGEAPVSAAFKTRLEDFQVEEIPGFEPEGEGEHLCLWIEKRDLTTPDAVRLLARHYGVPRRDTAWSGLKDRFGITRQWISLRINVKAELPAPLEHPQVRILEARRRLRKIRSGSHRGNRFRITLREPAGDIEALEARLRQLHVMGVPNYFGPQRFGRRGDNVAQALAWFRGEYKPRDRFLRGILLSAARAWLFNAVLDQRVRAGSWNRWLQGDVMALDGASRGFVPEAADPDIPARLASLDIHPSGPLWGRGDPATAGAVRAMEQALAERHPALCRGLEERGLEQERRALRLKVDAPSMIHAADGSLVIEFSLARGTYATSVLKELVNLRSDSP